MSRIRRSITPALITALLAGSAAALTAPSAAAQPADPPTSTVTLTHASWAYVDKATPRVGHANVPGDMPIGTWHEPGDDDDAAAAQATGTPAAATDDDEGVTHTARSFVAFDAARFAGAEIVSATLTTTETWAADCASRAVELWQTNAFEPTSTWRRQPSPRRLLASRGAPAGGACLAVGETFDVTDALVRSVDAGDAALTLGLRVREHRENRAAFARRFAPDATLAVTVVSPLATPDDVTVDGAACATTAPGLRSEGWSLVGRARFPLAAGPDPVTARMELARLDDPAQRVELSAPVESADGYTELYSQHQSELFMQHGVTYTVRMRAESGELVSGWSAPCHITFDHVGVPAPAVTSADYPSYPETYEPSGGVGVPGSFTFDARGDTEIVRFRYIPPGYPMQVMWAEPDVPGGTATVEWAPLVGGSQSMQVAGVEASGRVGETTYYQFNVVETRPYISADPYGENMWAGGIGVEGTFTLGARQPGAVELEYRFNDGPIATVPAAQPGEQPATVRFTPTFGDANTLWVRSRDANGVFGAPYLFEFGVSTLPRIDIPQQMVVGAPASVTFRPWMPDVVAYEWWYGWDPADAVTVPAGPDGTATVDLLPSHPYQQSFQVRSRTADGVLSMIASGWLPIDGGTPAVTRTGGTRPGSVQTLTVTSTTMPGVTAYRTWTAADQSDLRTVPADANGGAVIEWPARTTPGTFWMAVQATNATGALSVPASISVAISTTPEVTSTEFPWNGSVPLGRSGTFTFTPGMDGVTSYTYGIGSWVDPTLETTIPAGPDGTASIPFTTVRTGYHLLWVTSRTADGTVSSRRQHGFWVY